MPAFLRNLKISHRLYVGFAIVVLLLVGAVSTSIWQVSEISRISERISTLRAPTALAAERLTANLQGSLAALRGYLLTGKEGFKVERAALWRDIQDASATMDALAPRWTDPQDVQAWTDFKVIRDEFSGAQDKVEAIADPADTAPAVAMLVAEAVPRAGKLLTILMGAVQDDGSRAGGMVGSQTQLLRADSDAANADTSTLLTVQWVLLAVGLVAGALIAVVTSRAISRPLVAMTEAMGRLAEGQFETDIPGTHRHDEIGQMAAAVEVFKQNGIKVADLNAEEEERRGQTRERTEAMNALVTGLAAVVDAAVDGDFSRRITDSFKSADLSGVASGVNNLVATVDRGISETGQVLEALAEANLTQRVEGDFKGAFAKLKADTNAVGDKFASIVGQLRNTSRALKSATGEILAGANDLAERTTKQAAAIEETSAAMEQLAHTVTENAKRAESASTKANAVATTGENTGTVMHEANAAMERITTSSGKISNIIGLIDDIAFQTNLLALNASVEAARAGEAGKGFAVVAVEVRRLAQSAAEASKEVKVLIDQSASEVKGGSQLVADAAGKLVSMLEAVRENSRLIGEIAQASQEQSGAISQVTAAVRQMDEMTQHNAALVEETNAAIEQTEAQAGELDQVVDIFTLGDGGSSVAPVSRPSPAKAQPVKPTGVRALQARVKTAAKSYLTQGNAAVKDDWSEF